MHSRRTRIKVQPKIKDSSGRSTSAIEKSVTISKSSEKCSELNGTLLRVKNVNDSSTIKKLTLDSVQQGANLQERCKLQRYIDNESFPAPKLKIADGKVTIDEDSLVIPRILSPVRENIVEDKRLRSKVTDKLCEPPIKATVFKSRIKDQTCESVVKDNSPKSTTRSKVYRSSVRSKRLRSNVKNKACNSAITNKNSKLKTQHLFASHFSLEKKFGKKCSSKKKHKNEKCVTTISSSTEDSIGNKDHCSQINCNNRLKVNVNAPVPLRPMNQKIKDKYEQQQSVNCSTKELSDRKEETEEMKSPEDPLLPDDLINLHQGDLTANYDIVEPISKRGFPAPRLKIGPDGKLMIDEDSLVIEKTSSRAMKCTKNMAAALSSSKYEVKGNNHWDKYDTASFYRALSCFGTDFTFIADVLQKWSKKEVKRKYQKEYKKNPRLVNWICKHANIMKVKTSDMETDESANESMPRKNVTDVKKEICIDSRNDMLDDIKDVEVNITQDDGVISQNKDVVNTVMFHPPQMLSKPYVDTSKTQRQNLFPKQCVTDCQFVNEDVHPAHHWTCGNQFDSTENKSNKECVVDADKNMALTVDLEYVNQSMACDVDNLTSLKIDKELIKSNFDLETENTKLALLSERITKQKNTKRKWRPNISKLHKKNHPVEKPSTTS